MQKEYTALTASLNLESPASLRLSHGAHEPDSVDHDATPAAHLLAENAKKRLFGNARGSCMVSSFLQESLQTKTQGTSQAGMQDRVEELTDSISSAEKKLETCSICAPARFESRPGAVHALPCHSC